MMTNSISSETSRNVAPYSLKYIRKVNWQCNNTACKIACYILLHTFFNPWTHAMISKIVDLDTKSLILFIKPAQSISWTKTENRIKAD